MLMQRRLMTPTEKKKEWQRTMAVSFSGSMENGVNGISHCELHCLRFVFQIDGDVLLQMREKSISLQPVLHSAACCMLGHDHAFVRRWHQITIHLALNVFTLIISFYWLIPSIRMEVYNHFLPLLCIPWRSWLALASATYPFPDLWYLE